MLCTTHSTMLHYILLVAWDNYSATPLTVFCAKTGCVSFRWVTLTFVLLVRLIFWVLQVSEGLLTSWESTGKKSTCLPTQPYPLPYFGLFPVSQHLYESSLGQDLLNVFLLEPSRSKCWKKQKTKWNLIMWLINAHTLAHVAWSQMAVCGSVWKSFQNHQLFPGGNFQQFIVKIREGQVLREWLFFTRVYFMIKLARATKH